MTTVGDVNGAQAVRAGEFSAETQQSDQAINGLMTVEQSLTKQMSTDVIANADFWQHVLVVFTLLGIGIGGAVAFFLSRGVARGVQAVLKVLTSLTENCARSLEAGLAATSANDLSGAVHQVTEPIERYGRDEIG